jgi:eukaryotic-like serine/threonine-protein kinase
VVQSEFNEVNGQFSPDARWMAYRSDKSGRPEIYVEPFQQKGVSGRWPISAGGGYQPRWRSDGKELFYISPDSRVKSVEVNGNGAVFQHGAPKDLFIAPMKGGAATRLIFRWDVAPDGQRFLINAEPGTASSSTTVMINWQSALESKQNER